MEFRMSLEGNTNSGIDTFFISPLREKMEEYFSIREYGDGIILLGIVLVCRPSYLNFKQRKQFDKLNKRLFVDVMLDFEYAESVIDKNKLMLYVQEQLKNTIGSIVSYKQKIINFDFKKFEHDWNNLFSNHV